MTVKQYVDKKGWNMELSEPKPCRVMNVDVSFLNDKRAEDETQFSIAAYDINELGRLFTAFCKENGYPDNMVLCVSIVEMADAMNQLS